VFAEISSQPLMSANSRSYIGELVRLAGGVNIADSLPQLYGVINAETVVRQHPDIILVLHPQSSAAEVRRRLGWGGIPAVRQGRVYAGLDLDLLMRPGPRFVDAALALNRILYDTK
jgi:iron complex transport system substrate-binding protein